MSISIRTIFQILALLLVATFILHTFVPHSHPHESGDPLQVALHGEDRKWWAMVVLSSLLVAIASFLKERQDIVLINFVGKITAYLDLNFSKIFNPILEALRTGVLNPKLCA